MTLSIVVTTIIFGLPTGQHTTSVRLTLPTATLTVQDLIAHKVRHEIAEWTAQQRSELGGEYLSPEELLGVQTRSYPTSIAAEIARAQEAFAARAYMIVVDEQRLVDRHAMVALQPETRVEFIKILPLVGG